MLKKKSFIFALIGVLCFVAAMYFTYAETRANFDYGDFDETETDEAEETAATVVTEKPTAHETAEQAEE